MNPAALPARERALAVLIVVVLVGGLGALLGERSGDDPGFRRASADVRAIEIGLQPADEMAASFERTPTSARRVGELDIATHAPAGTEVTLPELAPVDFGDGVAASAPITGGYADLIRAFFGPVTVEALVIVQCESQFVPWAVGTNTNGTQDHGLFQINDINAAWFEAATGQPWESGRYDPVANTAFARHLYDQLGWKPWTCRSRLATID